LIKPTNQNNTYLVPKISVEGAFHTVDMSIGVCTCYRGLDGSPCPHQSAVTIKYYIENVNCIPISPEGRSHFAFLALGNKALSDTKYYSSLHEKSLYEKKQNLIAIPPNSRPIDSTSDGNGIDDSQLVTHNNHINANESSIDNNIKSDDNDILDDVQDFNLSKEWEEFVNEVDTDIKNGDPNFQYGLKRFLMAYKKARIINIQEASLFLQNDETARKYYKKNWRIRNNKRIKVQVTSIQRKKSNNSDSKRLENQKDHLKIL